MPLMRGLVDHLHANNQHYIVMVDPAVAYANNAAYDRGVEDNIFLKRSNGSEWLGVVWPGVTVFPDWFSPNVTKYWNNEFALFFSKDQGVDIDGLWIDSELVSYTLGSAISEQEALLAPETLPLTPARR